MMKIRIVEKTPPPSFHAPTPARPVRSRPMVVFSFTPPGPILGSTDHSFQGALQATPSSTARRVYSSAFATSCSRASISSVVSFVFWA